MKKFKTFYEVQTASHLKEIIDHPTTGASPRKFLWGGEEGFVKSWTSYPEKYLDLSEGATKTK